MVSLLVQKEKEEIISYPLSDLKPESSLYFTLSKPRGWYNLRYSVLLIEIVGAYVKHRGR